jgi:hypothetical protein
MAKNRSKHSRNDVDPIPYGTPKSSNPYMSGSSSGRSSGGHFRSGGSTKSGGSGAKSQGTKQSVGYTSYSRYAPGTYAARNKRGGKKHGVVGKVILIILLVIVASGAYLAISTRQLLNQYDEVKQEASVLKDQLVDGDNAGAQQTAASIAQTAQDMHATTSNPIWVVASHVPYIGDDIYAARVLCTSFDDLATNGLLPVVDSIQDVSIDDLIGDNATINVDGVMQVLNAVDSISPVIESNNTAIQGIGETHIDKVTEKVDKAKTLMSRITRISSVAGELSTMMPSMLGADGEPATYLIMAKNNSELNAGGGLNGSVGLMTVNNGQISLGDFSSPADLKDAAEGGYTAPTITDEEIQLFGNRIIYEPRDVGYTPDFARTGENLATIWAGNGLGSADGIIALDPIFLQDMLALTGGFTLSDGSTVDGTNAATILLHDVYWNITDSTLQDEYFRAVAAASAKQIFSNFGNANMKDLLTTVEDDIDAGNVTVWFADDSQEQLAVELGWAGTFSQDTTRPELGVYASDNSTSKLSWYLSINTQVGEATTNADGTKSYVCTTTFTNNLTADEEASLPEYVQSHSTLRRSNGDMDVYLYLIAPAGGSITNVSWSGDFSTASLQGTPYTPNVTVEGMAEASYEGRDVWYGQSFIAPQQTTTITYTVTVPADAVYDLEAHTTPTAQTVAGWE